MKEFILNDNEYKSAKDFIEEHSKSCKDSYYSYIFTPTGIGIGVSIRCNHCKVTKDITDYDSW